MGSEKVARVVSSTSAKKWVVIVDGFGTLFTDDKFEADHHAERLNAAVSKATEEQREKDAMIAEEFILNPLISKEIAAAIRRGGG